MIRYAMENRSKVDAGVEPQLVRVGPRGFIITAAGSIDIFGSGDILQRCGSSVRLREGHILPEECWIREWMVLDSRVWHKKLPMCIFQCIFLLSKFILDITDTDEGKHREEIWSSTQLLNQFGWGQTNVILSRVSPNFGRRNSAVFGFI